MAGRGLSFKSLKKSTTTDETKSELASETHSSTQSTPIPMIKSAGRGLGLAFPSIKKHVEETESTATPSVVSSVGFRSMAGRGMYAFRKAESTMASTTEVSDTKTLASKYSDSDPIETNSGSNSGKNYAISGLIAGRGTSGRGSGSSGGPITMPLATKTSKIPEREESLGSSEAKLKGAVPKMSSPTPQTILISKATCLSPTSQEPVIKRGEKGTPYTSMTNSIMLHCDPDKGVFEYEVRFNPAVDNISFRSKYIAQHKDVLGNARTFDGVILFLPHQLPNQVTRLISKNIVEGPEIAIEIIFKRKKKLGDCIQLYNILFEKIFKVLNYLRVGRKSFDPTSPKLIPQHKLEIWPGYVKAVSEQEGGLMLELDVSHRVLATRTVLDTITEAFQAGRNQFQDNVKKMLIGKIVLTRYNNKTYRIDDIIFDKSPKSTFTRGDNEISYVKYYKQQYNIDIQDMNQCLLISRKEIRVAGERDKREYMFLLIPELCYMTGLSDEMRQNYMVMKDLATYTKLTPLQRVKSFRQFILNVNNTPAAKEILSIWGLSLDSDPLTLTARLLNEEKIIFGRGREFGAGNYADFSRHATTNEVLSPISIQNWLLTFTERDKVTADNFESMIMKICGPTGIHVAKPRRLSLPNDRTDTYINEIRKALLNDQTIQIVVVIFPSLREDRYAAVKRVLCSDIPTPSQVINSKTLRNEGKNRSIVQKILLQMNCKLGGTLWSIKIPLQNTMICGVDTYHSAGQNGITVGGFVASLNPEFTRWYSRPTIQGKREELVNGLTASMEAALTAYKGMNRTFPERVIIYRDGVGDGQLDFVKQYEIMQFRNAFKRIESNYNPLLTFVVVQKRINTKFFKVVEERNGNNFVNPPPGSVLDQIVTSRYLYDFYLVSQHVREGTTTPSHYIVLVDDGNFSPDILQRLTYKLCYLYYNWPGTVRVPAPCQYAHKLADLIGLSVKVVAGEKLADKLYFL